MTEQSIQITSIQDLTLYENGKKARLSPACSDAIRVNSQLIQEVQKLVTPLLTSLSSDSKPRQLRVRISEGYVTIIENTTKIECQATTAPVIDRVHQIRQRAESLGSLDAVAPKTTIDAAKQTSADNAPEQTSEDNALIVRQTIWRGTATNKEEARKRELAKRLGTPPRDEEVQEKTTQLLSTEIQQIREAATDAQEQAVDQFIAAYMPGLPKQKQYQLIRRWITNCILGEWQRLKNNGQTYSLADRAPQLTNQLIEKLQAFAPDVLALLKQEVCEFLRYVNGLQSFKKLPEKKRAKQLAEIEYSTSTCHDFASHILITNPSVQEELGLPQGKPHAALTTYHELSHNSPLNGLGEVTGAITSSNDKKAPGVANLRRVSDHQDKTIAYTGRVDTVQKAREQATFIYQQEYLSRPNMPQPKSENGVLQVPYVIFSALGSDMLERKERKMLQDEEAALKEAFREPILIEGSRVQFTPVLMSHNFNSFGVVFAGESSRLLKAAKKRLLGLAANQEEVTRLINSLDSKRLMPEEIMLCTAHICDLLGMPIAYHCKSSVDRTGVMIAIASALRQWKNLELTLPYNLPDLLKNLEFKELFAANLMAGLEITKYARGIRGYKITHNPVVKRLMPERDLIPASMVKSALLRPFAKSPPRKKLNRALTACLLPSPRT